MLNTPKRLINSVLVLIVGFLFSCNSPTEEQEDLNDPMRYGISLDSLNRLSISCLERINQFRAAESLEPLERWTEGETCAHESSKSDSETGKAHGAFGACDERAQNECPGWNSLESINEKCLQSMWNENELGPDVSFSENGHYLNMSNLNYTKVACGFYQTPEGKVWAIQNFK
jgi:hypothetical protein